MRKIVVVVLLILILPTLGYSQQAYVGRFDGFGSYSIFSSPRLNLTARGFNGRIRSQRNPMASYGLRYERV
jgi:hypothetical protein